MKRNFLTNRLTLAFISILLVATISSSCRRKTEINCNYQGGIILEVDAMGFEMRTRYTIKYKGEIYYAYPYEIDCGYKAGDTIDNPCY